MLKRSTLLVMLSTCVLLFAQGQDTSSFSIGHITTNKGEIFIWLYNETPHHKASFIALAQQHYWDSLSFNRVIKNFVVQGGCPDTPEGFGGSPYLLQPEFSDRLRHVYGAVGAGRDDNKQMLSAGCQFYIVQNKNGLPKLNDKYTVFGFVCKGMDVVEKIVQEKTDSHDQPLVPITFRIDIVTMTKAQLSANGFKLPA